jgi:hypothetical protein
LSAERKKLVIPAKAGIQCLFAFQSKGKELDSGFRRNDEHREAASNTIPTQPAP